MNRRAFLRLFAVGAGVALIKPLLPAPRRMLYIDTETTGLHGPISYTYELGEPIYLVSRPLPPLQGNLVLGKIVHRDYEAEGFEAAMRRTCEARGLPYELCSRSGTSDRSSIA